MESNYLNGCANVSEYLDAHPSIKEYLEELNHEQWIDIESDIDFSKETPFDTSNSLHIYCEKYFIDNETYQLIYCIGSDNKPTIQKLINECK